MIKGFLIDAKNITAKVIDVPTDYKDIQKLLDVRVFTIVSRKIGKKFYDIYADDEGLFIENNPVSILTKNKSGDTIEQIVGSVLITRHNGKGGVKSLTDDEILEIRDNQKSYIDFKNEAIRPLVIVKL